jgi:integrase
MMNATAIVRDFRRGTIDESRPATPAAYLAQYVLERGLTQRSEAEFRRRLRRFERYLGRASEWDDFNDEQVNRWLAALAESGLAPETIRGHRSVVLAVWNGAWESGYLNARPGRIRRVKCPARRPQAWTLDELRALVAIASRTPGRTNRDRRIPRAAFWRAFLLTGYYTGLRLGDLLALRWSEVSASGLVTVTMRKTGDMLTAQLPEDAQQALRAIAPVATVKRLLVFGELINRSNVQRYFRRLVRRAGLAGSTKWLRRTGASHVEAELPGSAKAFLGHRTHGLAYRNYVDPAIAHRQTPRPPSLGVGG